MFNRDTVNDIIYHNNTYIINQTLRAYKGTMNIDENEMSIHRDRGRERLLLLRRNRLEHSAVNYNGALKRPTGSRMLTKEACNSFFFNEEIRTANEGRFGNLKRRRLTWQRLINATSNKARNQSLMVIPSFARVRI